MAPTSADKFAGKTNSEILAIFGAECAAAAYGGVIHAAVETPIVIPVEASITQTQINGKTFFWNFGDLFRRGAMYRSLPTALVAAAPKSVVHYAWLTLYMNVFVPTGSMREASTAQAVKVGLSTGASEVIFTTPLNLVKFRMQRPEWGYKGMFDAIRTILRTEGPMAFWKGTLPSFCRNSVCMAGMLGANKGVVNHLPKALGERKHLVAGMIGGVAGSLMSYPFEMWRAAQMHNRGFYEEMMSKGLLRLYAGWWPGATRLVITSGVMGELLPRMKAWSKGLQNDKK